MKQFLTVLKFELNSYFKNRSFMVTTLLLAALLAGVIVVPTLIPGLLDSFNGGNSGVETSQEETEKDDKGNSYGILSNGNEEEIQKVFPAEWVVFDNADEMKDAVKTEVVEAGFILDDSMNATCIVNNLGIRDKSLIERFQSAASDCGRQKYLMEKGLTEQEVWEAESLSVSVTPEILGKNSVENYWYTYVLVFIIYFLILFYGQMIAVSVTTEKSNRAIEILVTSVNSNSLIFGKVIAGALAGILQMAVILGAAFGAYRAVGSAWGGVLDILFDIPARVMVSFAVFGILSYLLYAFIYGALGALVSKTEDISKSSTPVTLVYVASFLVAMAGLTSSDSLLVKVASFIPFTSGNAMFIRISMGSVAAWEVALSLGLLGGSCVLVGVFAAKLFRFGTLHYGNPVKLTRALKQIKK